ncbi:hypothetical protein MTR67_046855 [Solanum verrucosum]|uniref:DUF4218 domain-containing protein n=1 Tax=Solanum verrucosum TaxID=315347 RepID=A0AAF0UVD9_SOLVR|nr:hypothetical protein MTR67_046855 [Solanum verrucosum]
MGIRKELQPVQDDNRRVHLAKACFSMKPAEKKLFCTVLKNAKLPKGCVSNISRCVEVDEMKISGYKSHDAHFIMHYLLQIAVRKVLPKKVSMALIRLENFFKVISSKVIRRADLDTMQSKIYEIICDFEKIFPPSFFDIMVHLPIHLVNEIKLGGPIHLRWMYSTERNLCFFKGLVRNRFHLEASILEGFVALERVNLCSRYLHAGVKTKFSRYQLEDEQGTETEGGNLSPIFPKFGHPIGREKKSKGNNFHMDLQLCVDIHRYVLLNTGDEKMETFIMEHKIVIDNHSRSNAWIRAQNHSQEFGNWFKEKVKSVEVPEHLRQLAKGPNTAAKRYTAYFINGYRFHTMKRDSQGKTQNYGVTLSATTDSFASARDQNPIDGEVVYYGVIQDIIEIDYWGCFSVVLFKCDWFQDPIVKDVYYARTKVHVDLFDLEEENCPNIGEIFFGEPDNDIGPSNGIPDADVDLRCRQYLVVMKQRESSRIRNKETRATVPAGTLTSLANQKKLLLAKRRKDLLIEKRQRLTDVIEEQDVLESHNPEVGVRIQTDSTNNVVQPVEEQLQLNSTAHKPVGLSNDVVIELSSFLGTLARNATLCPLDIENWKLLDTKQDLWDYTKEKYDIPEIENRWTLKTIQEAWSRRKFDLKTHHFDAYANDQIRMEKKPDDVPTSQFKELLKYWNSEKFQKMSKANSENRKKLKNPHTVGKKSFALLRNDLEKERETNDTPSPKEFFVVTRKRKPNRSYKDTDEDTASKIAAMENIEMQQNEDGNETIDAFASVMGSEHPGRLRLYGRGVTKTTLKGKVGNFEASSNATNDLVKKMEDRMLRMEEKIEEQKEQFDQQKTTMRQEIVEDVITKLQREQNEQSGDESSDEDVT